uniref:CCHC-type domain-containing protein n=1 Tax=Strongyloides venezuelensis TaxID=75913 RepID=A0A0K0FTF8_STRVS
MSMDNKNISIEELVKYNSYKCLNTAAQLLKVGLGGTKMEIATRLVESGHGLQELGFLIVQASEIREEDLETTFQWGGEDGKSIKGEEVERNERSSCRFEAIKMVVPFKEGDDVEVFKFLFMNAAQSDGCLESKSLGSILLQKICPKVLRKLLNENSDLMNMSWKAIMAMMQRMMSKRLDRELENGELLHFKVDCDNLADSMERLKTLVDDAYYGCNNLEIEDIFKWELLRAFKNISWLSKLAEYGRYCTVSQLQIDATRLNADYKKRPFGMNKNIQKHKNQKWNHKNNSESTNEVKTGKFTCFVCGQEGHKANICPEKKTTQHRRVENEAGGAIVQLPINLPNGEVKYITTYIDTGADRTLIS